MNIAKKNIIVVTSYQEFGELVSNSLQKNLTWNVEPIYKYDAIQDTISRTNSLDYALFDMEMGLEHVREGIFLVRDKFPETELILISKHEPPEEFEDFQPWKLLTKPFTENDLLEVFKYTNASRNNIIIEGKCSDVIDSDLPAWARNGIEVRRILTDAIANMDAQEAVLFSDHKVLAHAGKVRVTDIINCSDIIYKHLDPTGTGEVIKQIELNSKSYLLHATFIAVGLILAILYRSDIPYQEIRYQTRYFENRLANPKLSSMRSLSLTESNGSETNEQGNLKPMKVHENLKGNLEPQESQTKYIRSQDQSDVQSTPRRTDPSKFHPSVHNVPINEPGEISFPKAKSSDDQFSRVKPTRSASNLYYSCLFIPRIRSHYLTNDVYRFLIEEIPPIFPANGWRLESLIIDEQYMMWIALIPPTIASTFHIKTIRKISSRLILQNFVKFNRDGMISDFWAPGYHLEPGNQKISEQDIAEFINSNRRHYYPDYGNEKLHGSNTFA